MYTYSKCRTRCEKNKIKTERRADAVPSPPTACTIFAPRPLVPVHGNRLPDSEGGGGINNNVFVEYSQSAPPVSLEAKKKKKKSRKRVLSFDFIGPCRLVGTCCSRSAYVLYTLWRCSVP